MISLRNLTALLIILLFSCQKDLPSTFLDNHKYPDEVRNIFLGKCATSGCHNSASKDGAGGLDLTTWEHLFEGGRNGNPIIPFRPDQSYLYFFVNTDPALGISLQPTMPFNGDPLTRDEVLTIKSWIERGAPDSKGFVKFSDNPKRKKFYVVNQGCDLVAVYDAETKLIMRYVEVGNSQEVIESPHMIKISPDGMYWYVIFYNAGILQRFKTSDDSFAGGVDINNGVNGLWNTLTISGDSKYAYCVDWSANGRVSVVNLEVMSLIYQWRSPAFPLFVYPHGSSMGLNDSTLYITAQSGNFIYKIDIYDDPQSPNPEKISLDGMAPNTNSSLDPHEICFSPDKKKYFVTCQKSNELRIMQSSNDSLLAVIPVGDFPQEPVVSFSTDYLFVTCMEDVTNNTTGVGSVAVINYKTNSLIKNILTGFQPHGIGVDDEKKVVYVANRNKAANGLPSHHSSSCGGRNGYVTIIDMNSLELLNFKSETVTDPFSVAVRN